MIIWVLVTLVILLGILYLLVPCKFPSKELQDAINKIPGPDPLPFVGNIKIIDESIEDYFNGLKRLFDTYGDRVRLWNFGIPVILLFKSKDVQALLNSNQNINKSNFYNLVKPWLGEGLLTSSGEKWFLHRKLLNNAFHFQILNHHKKITYKYSQILLDLLEPHAKSGNPFNIYPYITNCSLDIICESAMGVPVNAQLQGSEYAESITRISALTTERIGKFWLRNPFTFMFSPQGREYFRLLKIIHGFANEVIQKRKMMRSRKEKKIIRNNGDEDEKEKLSFLDLLLEVSENDSRIGDKEIREEVDTFMFEGHDTTAAAINWCLFLLGNNPEIQEKVLEEVDYAMQLSDISKRLKELNLLERCIKETLRLYPSVPSFSRTLTNPLKLDGLTIPPGTTIYLFIYLLHRDPEVFPDPEKFDPDRFLSERIAGRNSLSYFPFSAGRRNCIGQKFAMIEVKLVLCMILFQFKIKSLEKPEEIGVSMEIITKPLKPLNTIIIKRQK